MRKIDTSQHQVNIPERLYMEMLRFYNSIDDFNIDCLEKIIVAFEKNIQIHDYLYDINTTFIFAEVLLGKSYMGIPITRIGYDFALIDSDVQKKIDSIAFDSMKFFKPIFRPTEESSTILGRSGYEDTIDVDFLCRYLRSIADYNNNIAEKYTNWTMNRESLKTEISDESAISITIPFEDYHVLLNIEDTIKEINDKITDLVTRIGKEPMQSLLNILLDGLEKRYKSGLYNFDKD